MLSAEDTLAMAEKMAELAEKDAYAEDVEGFWSGWAAGLRTLAQHICTDVKTTCFPIGSCQCHPFKITAGGSGSR